VSRSSREGAVSSGNGGAAAADSAASNSWVAAMPAVFVLIWATGFIVARYGMPHAPPFTFLAWRFGLSALCFALWVAWSRPAWPQGRAQWAHLAVVGLLMHGGYLGGVWAAVKGGAPAGVVALVVGLRPVLTAVWVSMVGERASGEAALKPWQWAGLVLGFLGLALVLWPKLSVGIVSLQSLLLAVFALLSITAGTLYQKRHVQPCDARTANTVQLLAGLGLMLVLASFESETMRWHPELIGALAWSVLVLTLAGSSMLYLLIQRGAATQVTSLFYLVPPTTAVMAWLLFGERMAPVSMLGLGLAALGVALVVRR
jgi:drug/metabolite transporter (DMT)-like permease